VEPLQALFEAPSLPGSSIPMPLRELYGGDIGFRPGSLYANFVASLDGVVAIEPLADSSSIIAAGSEADRLVMGLLRAFADAVIIGAGTLRAAPDHRWTAQYILPDQAPAFAELRAALRKGPGPRLVVVTASGRVDVAHPALEEEALVLTTASGAQVLRGHVPAATTVQTLSDGAAVAPRAVADVVRAAGHDLLLCEGGPTVLGDVVERGLADRYVFYIAPKLLGSGGLGAISALVAPTISDARELRIESVRHVGADIRIEAYPRGAGAHG
jgi:riboflavin biosynthesis pyrimidine reductase